MRKIICSVILFLSSAGFIFAQRGNDKTLWGAVEFGYGRGLGDNGRSFDLPSKNIYGRMHLFRIGAKAGYYLTPQFSLGAGVGLAGYHNPDANTLPVFVDLRFRLKSMPKLYVFADIGGSFLGDAYTEGFISDMGIACKIPTGRRTSLNPSLGYDIFLYSDNWGVGNEKRSRHTIFIKLEFEF